MNAKYSFTLFFVLDFVFDTKITRKVFAVFHNGLLVAWKIRPVWRFSNKYLRAVNSNIAMWHSKNSTLTAFAKTKSQIKHVQLRYWLTIILNNLFTNVKEACFSASNCSYGTGRWPVAKPKAVKWAKKARLRFFLVYDLQSYAMEDCRDSTRSKKFTFVIHQN